MDTVGPQPAQIAEFQELPFKTANFSYVKEKPHAFKIWKKTSKIAMEHDQR